jgi:hypothetical protein
VKLTTYLRLLLRLKIRGAIPLLPHTSSWRGSWLSSGTILPLSQTLIGTVRVLRHAFTPNLERVPLEFL